MSIRQHTQANMSKLYKGWSKNLFLCRENTPKKTRQRPSPQIYANKYSADAERDFLPPFLKLKGSMTVEAAIVLPIFIFFCMTIVLAFDAMNTHVTNELELVNKAKLISVYGGEAKELLKDEVTDKVPFIKDDRIILFAVNTFGKDSLLEGITAFSTLNYVETHLWNGYEVEKNENDTYVYVTEHGEVYHKDANCTYIHIKAEGVLYEHIELKRNKSGEKYRPCKTCGKNHVGSFVFITGYGQAYHTSKECPAIKREVKTIRLSEAKNYRPCKKCYGGN